MGSFGAQDCLSVRVPVQQAGRGVTSHGMNIVGHEGMMIYEPEVAPLVDGMTELSHCAGRECARDVVDACQDLFIKVTNMS